MQESGQPLFAQQSNSSSVAEAWPSTPCNHKLYCTPPAAVCLNPGLLRSSRPWLICQAFTLMWQCSDEPWHSQVLLTLFSSSAFHPQAGPTSPPGCSVMLLESPASRLVQAKMKQHLFCRCRCPACPAHALWLSHVSERLLSQLCSWFSALTMVCNHAGGHWSSRGCSRRLKSGVT